MGASLPMIEGWKHVSEPIVLPEGGEVYWIEQGDYYQIIPKPMDPETECFFACSSVPSNG
jgi:hypothetical protein